MLVVIVIVVIAWLYVSETGKEKIAVLLSIGLIVSFIVAVIASLPPIIEIPIAENEYLRVYSSAAYPFCIQQYHNYDTDMFRYLLSFGWPEGIPLLELSLQEDQSHFIHAQHYFSGLSLGLVLLLGMIVLVGLLTLIERKKVIGRKLRTSSAFLLITLQLALIIVIITLYLLENIIYPIGGITVLLVTLYPTYRAIRSSGLLEGLHNG
ncbi:MAG: hypothetical protein E4H14_00850 [Candidatus Thorarchaeota archaeon]|nr:MAG: hypothetical protein E4H14_00850 [Candidatus Thorarchaeota archaeon]